MKVLSTNLGSEILADLRARFPGIPNKGVLAGGAVADWFLGIEPNDIDIFVESNDTKKLFGINTANFGMPNVEEDVYRSTLSIAWKQLYEVISSEREGMLNFIKVRGQSISASKIITGFDLNATRVGIDLDTEKLVWDESFANFLKTKKLQITALFTPAHTAIRYFNKKARLNCKGDDDVEMSIISSAWQTTLMGVTKYSIPYQFGKIYCAKAELALSQGMDEYFELDESDKFWTLTPIKWPDFKMSGLNHIMYPVHAPQALRSQTIPMSSAYVEKLSMVFEESKSDFVTKNGNLFQGSYVRGKVTPRMVHTVSLFAARRPYLTGLLLGVCLEKQVQIIRRFARFARKNGGWVYGLAQVEATTLDIVNDDSFEALITRFEDKYSKPVTIAIENAPKNFLWYNIKQVLDPKELYSLTESMRLTTENHENVLVDGSPIFKLTSRFSSKVSVLVQYSAINDSDLVSARHIVSHRSKVNLGVIVSSMWIKTHFDKENTFDHAKAFCNTCLTFAKNKFFAGKNDLLKRPFGSSLAHQRITR